METEELRGVACELVMRNRYLISGERPYRIARTVNFDASPAPETAASAHPEAPAESKQPPPPSPAADLSLPPVQTSRLDNGLEVNTVVADALPVVYATLVVRSGAD